MQTKEEFNEKRKIYMREYRQKKQLQKPVETKQEPIEKPIENPIEEERPVIEPLVEAQEPIKQEQTPELKPDCQRFRKMIAGDLPRDGLFLGDHDVKCPSCNQWRIYFERGEESGFVKAHADPFHGSGEPDDFGECPEDYMKDFDSSTLKPEQQNDKDDSNVSDNQ